MMPKFDNSIINNTLNHEENTLPDINDEYDDSQSPMMANKLKRTKVSKDSF